jgi:anaerobic ribonucleoside-triphosphate reductase activating protein
MDTWTAKPANATVEALLAGSAAFCDADGLTVTGGEPFEQPDALYALLRGWRDLNGGDVLVFSGHPLEAIMPRLTALESLIDCIVTDPFRASAGQTLALRGSDNQRLVCLTELGRQRFAAYERQLNSGDRALDVLFDDITGEVFMAGIPTPGDMLRLAAALGDLGHMASVTEDGRPMPC